MSDATGSERPLPQPRPAKRACVICHSRKVKCDGAVKGFPCTNCRIADLECVVAARRKRRKLNQPADAESLSAELPSRPDIRSGTRPTNIRKAGQREYRTESLDAKETNERRSRVTTDHGKDDSEASGDSEQEVARQHLADFFGQEDLQKDPIKARLTYVGNDLSNLNFLTRQRSSNGHVYHYACANPYVPRVYKNARPPEKSLIPQDAFVLPPKHVSDALIDAYFDSVHPTFPIIDKHQFLELYHSEDSAPSLLVFQAVCLAGAHAVKVFKNNQELKVALFRRAKALLEGRYEQDRLEMVQGALLLAWFSDGGDDICANAWWWIGLAARTALGLGMHREIGPSRMPDEDKKTWRRMWWCLVQFDSIVSLCYGRSKSINLDDCDVPPLTPEDFEHDASPTSISFVIHHTELCTLVSELMQSHFTVKATATGRGRQQALATLDAKLAEWFMDLPLNIRYDGGRQDPGGASTDALILHLTYNAVLTQFHRLMVSRNGSRSDEDICIEASNNILNIFDQLIRQDNLEKCWFSAPSFLFTAMLQVRMEVKSSENNPILSLKAREKENSGMRSLRHLAKYWLFASSVWRLFKSNSLTNKMQDSRITDPNATTPDFQSPGQASSVATAPSMQLVPANTGPNTDPVQHGNFAQQQTDEQLAGGFSEMDWIQLADPRSAPMNIYTDQNRMQQSLSGWQNMYWTDPLADLSLLDDGTFQQSWM